MTIKEAPKPIHMKPLNYLRLALFIFKENLWDAFDSFNFDRLNHVDVQDVFKAYVKSEVKSASEFALSYTQNYYEKHGEPKDERGRHRMIQDVHRLVNRLEKYSIAVKMGYKRELFPVFLRL